MSKVSVFFVDNHKAVFDRDKVCFKGADGDIFTLSEGFQEEEMYSRLIDDGRALVNWDNVCFVREHVEDAVVGANEGPGE